jgi:HSP20 family protein
MSKKKDKETTRVRPAVDIYENDDGFMIVADMPGVASGDVSINHDAPTLTVEGRQSDASRAPLVFVRSFSVPDTVEPEGIDAKLTDGVLRITLKKAESSKPRRIEVRTG